MGKNYNKKVAHIHTGRLDEYRLSYSQKLAVEAISENTITFLKAQAAAGKSFAALYALVRMYHSNKDFKLYIVRAPKQYGDEIGHLPNSEAEKVAPFFSPYTAILKDMLGAEKFEADLDKRIIYTTPTFMLGVTLDDALVFVDEAQMLQPIIMELLLTRIGENAKIVVAGDNRQILKRDSYSRNGLSDAIERFTSCPNGFRESQYDDIAYVEFDPNDCMRHGVVRSVIKAYSEDV